MSEITDLSQIVTDFGSKLDQKLDALIQAEAAARQATAEALAAKNAIGNTSTGVNIWVDAVNGDDANSGVNAATAVKSWARVTELLQAGKKCLVACLSDIVADTKHTLTSPPTKIYFLGYNDNGTAIAQRKLSFVNDINNAQAAGGWTIDAGTTLLTYMMDIEMNYSANSFPLLVNKAPMLVSLTACTITRVGSSSAALLGGNFFGHIDVANFTLGAGASGHILSGVAAGGDPNALPGVTSNFTTA